MNMPQRSASFSGSESPSAPVSPFSQPVSPTAESSIRPVSSQTIDLDLNGSRDVDRSKSQTATPDPSWGGYPTAKGVSPSRPPRPRTNSGGRVAAASYGSASPSKDSQDLRRALHRSSSSPATPMLSSQSLKDIERLMGPEMGPRQGPPSLDDRLLSIQEADDQEGTGETDDRVTGASKAEKPVIRVWNTFDSVNLGILRRRTDSGGGPPTMQRSLSFSEEQDAAGAAGLPSTGSRGDFTPPAVPSPTAKATNSLPAAASPSTAIPSPKPEAQGGTNAPAIAPSSSMPTLWGYLAGEIKPGPTTAVADPIWGATERDVMYNSLIYVPYQLERLMWFGMAVCMDPFLSVFTTIPLRALKAVGDLLRGIVAKAGIHGRSTGTLLRGDQVYDILYMAMFAFASWVVMSLNAGVIYFWMKDLSQEFIKLSVIFTAMEICDKILTSFGVSSLHSLSCSCTQYYSNPDFSAVQVAADFLLATAITTAHAVALMSEAIAFSVAMNSRRTTLLALVISFNFAEVKGTVFKKLDPNKLSPIVYQDIVERFHMMMLMMFVIIEDMDTSDSWGSLNWQLLLQVSGILASELVADTTKHAVVGKFNVIRPGVYREYMRDLCEGTANGQSNTLFKVVQMEPLGTAAIFYRMIMSFVSHVLAQQQGKSMAERIPAYAAMVLVYGGICFFKLSWGYFIRWVAASYLTYYEDKYGKTRSSSMAHKQMPSTKKDN